MSFAGFIRHEQIHIVLAVAARMQGFVSFFGTTAVAEHTAHTATVTIWLAGYGVSGAVSGILYTINGTAYYRTSGASCGCTLCGSAKVIAVGVRVLRVVRIVGHHRRRKESVEMRSQPIGWLNLLTEPPQCGLHPANIPSFPGFSPIHLTNYIRSISRNN